LDLAEIAITSQARLVQGPGPAGAYRLDDVEAVAVEPRPAEGKKCQRCWKVLPDVDRDPHYLGLDPRCADAVAAAKRKGGEC
jgi:isoleucyl-tRNA synthetase